MLLISLLPKYRGAACQPEDQHVVNEKEVIGASDARQMITAELSDHEHIDEAQRRREDILKQYRRRDHEQSGYKCLIVGFDHLILSAVIDLKKIIRRTRRRGNRKRAENLRTKKEQEQIKTSADLSCQKMKKSGYYP